MKSAIESIDQLASLAQFGQAVLDLAREQGLLKRRGRKPGRKAGGRRRGKKPGRKSNAERAALAAAEKGNGATAATTAKRKPSRKASTAKKRSHAKKTPGTLASVPEGTEAQ